MLAETDAIATVAVKNLPAAAEFYSNKLGLEKVRSARSRKKASYSSDTNFPR